MAYFEASATRKGVKANKGPGVLKGDAAHSSEAALLRHPFQATRLGDAQARLTSNIGTAIDQLVAQTTQRVVLLCCWVRRRGSALFSCADVRFRDTTSVYQQRQH